MVNVRSSKNRRAGRAVSPIRITETPEESPGRLFPRFSAQRSGRGAASNELGNAASREGIAARRQRARESTDTWCHPTKQAPRPFTLSCLRHLPSSRSSSPSAPSFTLNFWPVGPHTMLKAGIWRIAHEQHHASRTRKVRKALSPVLFDFLDGQFHTGWDPDGIRRAAERNQPVRFRPPGHSGPQPHHRPGSKTARLRGPNALSRGLQRRVAGQLRQRRGERGTASTLRRWLQRPQCATVPPRKAPLEERDGRKLKERTGVGSAALSGDMGNGGTEDEPKRRRSSRKSIRRTRPPLRTTVWHACVTQDEKARRSVIKYPAFFDQCPSELTHPQGDCFEGQSSLSKFVGA